jgi:hypothetical protein
MAGGTSLDPALDASALRRAVQSGTEEDTLAILRHCDLARVALILAAMVCALRPEDDPV